MADAPAASQDAGLIDLISNDDVTDYDSDTTLKDDSQQPQTATDHDHAAAQVGAVCKTILCIKHVGSTLKAGKCAELIDGSFLRITELLQEVNNEKVFLKGHRFRRNVELSGLLELKRNEVHQLIRQTSGGEDASEFSTKNIWFIHLSDVVRVRELIKTNLPWPAKSYKEIEPDYHYFPNEWQKDHFRLVCRWKYLEVNAKQGIVLKLRQEECDIAHSASDSVLQFSFRGNTIKHGSCNAWLPGERQFDTNERLRTHNRDPLGFYSTSNDNLLIDLTVQDSENHRYTLGDGFCCSGGTSRGAKGAGLRVSWGFDHDPAAIHSYQKNFAHASCWVVDAHHFVALFENDREEAAKVDILHLSPPCQTFSPAHTRQGQNDDQNSASFFALEEVIKTVKPRIVTIEETFGLTGTLKNIPYFRAMIQTLTRLAFSVRWNVFNLREFGLPQPRKRLIIIASCPGETLPPFPQLTHCDPIRQHLQNNRKPYTTVNQIISQIPAGISLHNPDQMPLIHEFPYNGNESLRTTITCGTGQSWHPSGTRAFTLREIACLQGFPLEHEFGTVGIRKQIGNAVPPLVAKLIFETIIQHLKKVDSM